MEKNSNGGKKLVILTPHFGTNFSGGSKATSEIFSRIESNFEEIIVISKKLGKNQFKSITHYPYKNTLQALNLLRKKKSINTIYYGDFYNAVLFVLLKLPFYFTYHDNWPELGKTSIVNCFRSLLFTTIYKIIFYNARMVFTVSRNKYEYIKRYNSNVKLVRNGFNVNYINLNGKIGKSILMVGTIDKRKYKLAIDLFRKFSANQDINIDIYGNIKNKQIARRLNTFPFVNLKGFYEKIPYPQYAVLLHTSQMENLSIVLCEAVFHGVPVLAFDVGGTCEIIDKKNGVLVPPYDLDKMKEKLFKIIHQEIKIDVDPEVLSQFSWENASSIYLKHFKR